jgi:hypothetical protein
VARALQLAVLGGLFAAARPSAHAREAADCEPTATVEGGGAAQARVVDELRSRGISTVRIPGCAFVTAQLEVSAAGLAVTIVDAYGRTSERSANGPVAAATLIESWVRTDVSASLLSTKDAATEAAAPTEQRPPPRPSITEEAHPTLTLPAAPGVQRPGSQLSVTASAETSIGTDGSLWLGMSAGLCFRVGAACAGALVRVSDDSGTFGESREMRTARLGTDILLGASLPIRKGPVTLLPGLAVGVGWLRTTALSTTAPNSGSDGFDIDGGGLRASATMSVSIALTRRIAIDLGMAADLLPLAHTAPFSEGSYILAGEPRALLRGTAGIRVGLP